MDISASLVGQLAFAFAIICAVAGYVFGRRNSSFAILYSVVGFVCGLIPPLGLVFIIVMALKKRRLPINDDDVVNS